jgi:hypothetical protein
MLDISFGEFKLSTDQAVIVSSFTVDKSSEASGIILDTVSKFIIDICTSVVIADTMGSSVDPLILGDALTSDMTAIIKYPSSFTSNTAENQICTIAGHPTSLECLNPTPAPSPSPQPGSDLAPSNPSTPTYYPNENDGGDGWMPPGYSEDPRPVDAPADVEIYEGLHLSLKVTERQQILENNGQDRYVRLKMDILNFGTQNVCAVAIKIEDIHYHLTYDFLYNYKNLVLMAGTKNIVELNPVTAMPLNSASLVKAEVFLQMPWDKDISNYPAVSIAGAQSCI